MSHFAVLVVGEDVEGQLAPFHEFECTGVVDEYVQELNITEEVLEEWNTKMTKCLKDSSGELHPKYDDRFLRDVMKDGVVVPHSREYYVPEGFEEVEVPLKSIQTFKEFVEDYYGYQEKDTDGDDTSGYHTVDELGIITSVIRRTNPNAKWDWWVVGGRYRDLLLTKDGKLVDSALVGDIDWETMRAEAEAIAANKYDEIHRLVDGVSYETWETIQARHPDDINAAREEYRLQPFMIKIRESGDWWLDEPDILSLLGDRDAHITSKGNSALVMFAAVKDKQWYEKGEMGWFACVSNEKSDTDWNETFRGLIKDLSPDTLLTVVDCHI